MSVPRPAMLVEMVMAPRRPAWATMPASRSCCLALSTSKRSPSFLSRLATTSDFSTEVVPTRTGCPRELLSRMSSNTARNLPFSFL